MLLLTNIGRDRRAPWLAATSLPWLGQGHPAQGDDPRPRRAGPREPRGPGARGWCKTPSAGGPGGPKKAQNTPKWGIMAKNPDFRDFWLKWPFLAISRQNSPVATGLKVAENPIFGVFLQKRGKIPGFRDPRAGVLHQPLAPGPRGSRGRGSGAPPGRGWPRGLPEALFGPPGSPDPGTPGRYRGAPARGVDVKPPSRAPPGPGLRDPRALESPPPGAGEPSGTPGLRDLVPGPGPGPLPGPRGLRRPLRRPGRRPPSPWRGVVLHQPLAAGPRGTRRVGTCDATSQSHSRPPRPSSVR